MNITMRYFSHYENMLLLTSAQLKLELCKREFGVVNLVLRIQNPVKHLRWSFCENSEQLSG